MLTYGKGAAKGSLHVNRPLLPSQSLLVVSFPDVPPRGVGNVDRLCYQSAIVYYEVLDMSLEELEKLKTLRVSQPGKIWI